MALKDPAATSCGGVDASIIGLDPTAVYDAAPNGLNAPTVTLNTTLTYARIGGATASLEDPRYAGKAVRVQAAVGAVADGAVVANTYLNRSGKALVAGKHVVAVAP